MLNEVAQSCVVVTEVLLYVSIHNKISLSDIDLAKVLLSEDMAFYCFRI
jgi:hypothetical protein